MFVMKKNKKNELKGFEKNVGVHISHKQEKLLKCESKFVSVQQNCTFGAAKLAQLLHN